MFMRKRMLSLALATVMALGLAVPALAFTTPDFTDLPSDNWAYESVMRMADAGVIKGTGGGAFSPEMKVSVAQFLTLVGRVVFPDVKAEGADWYGPYIAAAQESGLLTGTQVDIGKPEAEISRYDMAVILRGAAQKLGKSETLAQQSQVADYGEIPTKYAEAVLAVYGMGLIRGDQNGNFNGANTMMRNETATVMDRLIALKGENDPGGSTTEPEKPVEPLEPDMVHISLKVRAQHPVPYSQAVGYGRTFIHGSTAMKLLYTEDGGKTSTVIGEGYSQSYTPGTSWDDQTIEFDVDQNVVKAGKGEFYLSGEMDYDGIHYATHDLRTDGRTAVIPLDMDSVLSGYIIQHVEMVPAATGYQRKITLNQFYSLSERELADRRPEARCIYYSDPEKAPSVQPYAQTPLEGVLMASAPFGSDGHYHMEFSIDVLDYQPDLACYRIFIVDANDGTVLGRGGFETLHQMVASGRGKID